MVNKVTLYGNTYTVNIRNSAADRFFKFSSGFFLFPSCSYPEIKFSRFPVLFFATARITKQTDGENWESFSEEELQSRDAGRLPEVSRSEFRSGISPAERKSCGKWRLDDIPDDRFSYEENPSPSKDSLRIRKGHSRHASPGTSDEALIRSVFALLLLVPTTLARHAKYNEQLVSSSSDGGVAIESQGAAVPNAEKTKESKPEVFIPAEENLMNVSKNGGVENNISSKKNKQRQKSETARSDSGSFGSREGGTGSGQKFVKVSTLDRIDSRTLNSHQKNLEDLSKILLYPVNGTTVIYRETTFRPIVDKPMKKEEKEGVADGASLPLATWSQIDETGNPDDGTATDEDVIEAADFGLEAMNNLYYIKEPKLFSLGLFLTDDNPGRYVAAFNGQTEQARQLARFGFAALEGASSLVTKHPDISRATTFERNTRRTALHRQCPRRGIPPCPPASLRYRTTDGSCNNPNELWWGSAMSAMQRFLQPVYQDGIQTIRRSVNGRLLPSPRQISSLIHQDQNVPLASVTHMLMQWGQFVDHDLTATGQSRGFNGTIPQCCLNGGASFQPQQFMHPECLPIPVPVSDKFYGPLGVRCLEFLRSGPAPREDCGFGPREQLSQVTSYLDASTVYSSNVEQSDSLRLFRNGLLQYGKVQSRKPLLPRQDTDLCRRGSLATNCFQAGDGRLSEQPALISLHVVFLRQHNRIATQLAALNQHWSDEKLFQETRRIIGALVQQVTYREFLPIVLGPEVIKAFDLEIKRKGYYDGYDPTVNPNIANEFAAAAYRFGHSLVQHTFMRYDSDHRPIFNNVTIHDEFSNPVNLHTPGSVDRLLLGLINQPSQKRDEFITEELTNHLFQTPGFPFGMDLASLNIQRGRDHGLPPYVDWREPCGLSPIKNWEDLDRVMFNTAARKFRALYASIQDIDLFPGGLAEKPVPGGLVGPTFACIIAQQFSNLRKGDRFWYENPNRENSFTAAQLQQIKRVTLAQILCRTTENVETIQPFVFLTSDTFRNERIDCDSEIIGSLNLDPWIERQPLEQRSKIRIRKGNRRKRPTKIPQEKTSSVSAIDRRGDEAEQGVSGSEEKSLFPFFRPPQSGVSQQNKVVIRRPSDTHENLTILVQNNAINSPVFVSDTVKGSNFQFTQSIHHDDAQATYRPNPETGSRPVRYPASQDTAFVSQRPIYFDDTQPNPVVVPQNVHRPTPKPTSQSMKPRPKPKPKPPTSYVNPAPYPGPYIPQTIDDPSNPNPPSYGFASRPTNNQKPSNSFFDAFAPTTTERPTLYTFYTTFKRPTSTPRPSVYYYEDSRPQNDQTYHSHDQHHQHDHQSQQQSGYGASNPSISSWFVNSDQIISQKPIYDQSWTAESSYEQNWPSKPTQDQNHAGGEWVDFPAAGQQSNVGYYGKPTQNRPRPTPPGQPGGYWAEISTTTKKYNYYYDTEWQIQNAEANINPRPFKKQSVTIITDSNTNVHYSDNQRLQQHQDRNEVPKPLIKLREKPEFPQHKDAFEIELDQILDKRMKPGQYYYDKNILHRYPDQSSMANKSSNDNGDGWDDRPAYDSSENVGGYKIGYQNGETDRIVIDSKYQLERLDPNRKSGGGPGPIKDTETKAQVTRDEMKLTTTATVVLDDKNEHEDDYDDAYDDGEDEDEEEIVGAYSEKSAQIVLPADRVISPIDWINVQENSSLTLNPEMPNLVTDELISTKEIPKPLRQRRPAT